MPRLVYLVGGALLGWGSIGAVELAATGDRAMPVPVEALGKPGSGHWHDAFDPRELERRLAGRGMAVGNPILIRIFKLESELELWMAADARFELIATYPICNWSGVLGPKLAEGDKQSPEGLYSIGRRQLRRIGRWPRSLDIGFPNTFDRALGRTGSYVLLHGGCTSTGCYAMTDPVMEEIFRLSEAALGRGQKRIPVHAFPFRMTPENVAGHAGSEWHGFWSNLKEANDLFERTRIPPQVSVCDNRYVVGEREPGSHGNCRSNASTGRFATARWKGLNRLRRAGPSRRAAVARQRQAVHAGGRHRTQR
jgi:murein L,D-transpeptidase YafK